MTERDSKKSERKGVVDATLAALTDLVSSVPASHEPKSDVPVVRAAEIQRKASLRAAAISGALALPPGPAMFLTIIPDLVGIWKVQAQMVADIAAAFGRTVQLSREEMLFCLFRHAAAQAFRDVTVRLGGRLVVGPASLRVIEKLIERLGMQVSRRVIAKSAARWVPVVGAAGVAAYAYFDTTQVGATAVALFSEDIAG
jgi:hypothetical protein